MDRVEGYTTNATKVRDGLDIMEMVHDPAILTALSQLQTTMAQTLVALNGIRARLDAGIKTQSGIISLNL